MTFDLVLSVVCEREMGYTLKAQERKIQDGIWLENYEYVRAPDGRIHISKSGVQRWAAGLPRVALRPPVIASKSALLTAPKKSGRHSTSGLRNPTSSTQDV